MSFTEPHRRDTRARTRPDTSSRTGDGHLGRREWVCRFADRMVEATDYEMSLREAVRLGEWEFERWCDASPEATVERFVLQCRHDHAVVARRVHLPLAALLGQRVAQPRQASR